MKRRIRNAVVRVRWLLPPVGPPRFQDVTRPHAAEASGSQPPSGIGYVYTAMHDRLRQQRETVDRIDSKAAILIGFLAVFLAGITSVPKDVYGIEHSRLLVGLLLGGSIICGLKSLWPRAWHSAPDPHEVIRQELWTAQQAMAADAGNAYASVVVNEGLLSDKLWWFRACLVLLATSVFVFVCSVAIKIGWQKI